MLLFLFIVLLVSSVAAHTNITFEYLNGLNSLTAGNTYINYYLIIHCNYILYVVLINFFRKLYYRYSSKFSESILLD